MIERDSSGIGIEISLKHVADICSKYELSNFKNESVLRKGGITEHAHRIDAQVVVTVVPTRKWVCGNGYISLPNCRFLKRLPSNDRKHSGAPAGMRRFSVDRIVIEL